MSSRMRMDLANVLRLSAASAVLCALLGVQSASAAVSASGSTSANPTSAGADPIIGVTDIGRLTITAGSTVTSDVAILGEEVNGIGDVLVTDFNPGTAATSTWNTNQLTVGHEGTGRLEILNGAFVNVHFASLPGTGDLIVGAEADSLGTVIVSGLGSMLRLGDDAFLGIDGTGVLIIEDEGYVVGTNDAVSGVDTFTVGLRGRVELNNGRLRTESLANNGAIVGHGRIDSENTIVNSTTGRLEVGGGDRLVVNAGNAGGVGLDNDGEIAVVGGEIEFLERVTNTNTAAEIALLNGVVRFPKTGFGFDSTTGVLATTGGTNDIYGTVRIQGASSRIVVAGESTAVFHDPVTNAGGVIEVFPGSSAVYLQGLTTTGSGSALSIHLAAPDEDPDFGQVEVGGSAALDGTLQVQLAGGFVPANGDAFQILTAAGGITGSLSLAAEPTLPSSLQWDLDINASNVVLSVVSTGDYNGNGAVDAADYVLWRKTLNQTGAGLAADGNGNGVVDPADYDFWRTRFGNTEFAIGTGAAAAVPESTTMSILCSATILLLRRRRIKSTRRTERC